MNHERLSITILKKKSHHKYRKNNNKNQSEIAAFEQRYTGETVNFYSNAVFPLYFKIRAKKSRCKTTHFFTTLLDLV